MTLSFYAMIVLFVGVLLGAAAILLSMLWQVLDARTRYNPVPANRSRGTYFRAVNRLRVIGVLVLYSAVAFVALGVVMLVIGQGAK